MDRFAREREQLERDLRAAIEHDLIEPRFRPSLDLKTGAVLGFEAVPTWISPETGDIPPERFLPVAEETGRIHTLARRVLEHVNGRQR